jgi:hypothetical protein
MTAVLGSGPLVIEEVQEEVTDDEEEREQQGQEANHSLPSPLQTVNQLSAASFVPIAFSLRRQTALLDELQQAEASSRAPPSPHESPVADIDVEAEAEGYDFSQIHRPEPEPPVMAPPLPQEEDGLAAASSPIAQELEEDQPVVQEEGGSVQYSGFYDEEGNWRYHNYDHGYYDPQGEWHDTTAEGAGAAEVAPEEPVRESDPDGLAAETAEEAAPPVAAFEETAQGCGEAEAAAEDSELASVGEFASPPPTEDEDEEEANEATEVSHQEASPGDAPSPDPVEPDPAGLL